MVTGQEGQSIHTVKKGGGTFTLHSRLSESSAGLLTCVNKTVPNCPFCPVLTPKNPHRSKIFFPRSHFRPCRGIRNWLPVYDLTFICLIFLKKRVLPLVLLSDTPENTCFRHPPNVSPGRKIRASRPFWGDAASKVVSPDPKSDQFDPSKWSVWGYNWLWKFENLLRKFENRLWK